MEQSHSWRKADSHSANQDIAHV